MTASIRVAVRRDRDRPRFSHTGIRLAEALETRGQRAYQYLFEWESPWDGGALGSPHAIDIGFVFGTHASADGSAEFFGSGAAADRLAARVQEAWLAFASSGDPRTDALQDWRPYDVATRATAIFDDPVAIANDPYGAERAIWDETGAEVGTI